MFALIAGPFRFVLRLSVLLAATVTLCAVANGDASGESPEILVLTNGERVPGISVGLADGSLRWRMPYGGELLIPLTLVDRIDASPGDPPADTPAEPAPESEPAPELEPVPEEPKKPDEPKKDAAVEPASAEVMAPPVVGDPPPLSTAWYDAMRSTYSFVGDQTDQWIKRFEFGGTWVDGNTETSTVYVGGSFERKFDKVFHQLDWNGRYATAGEEVTQSRWQFNGNTDFTKYSDAKWILFTTHRHLFDELADLDYRGTFASGIGYRFINESDKRLIMRLGPGATVEKYGDPNGTRVTPDVFAEVEARWPVLDRTQLEYKSTLTPSVAEVGVFRATSNYSVLVKLDETESWAMRVGLRHEHNSAPNADTRKDDFTTTFSVVYTRGKR